ncbi:hypothetical protein CKM354_000906200 [Cercospora kikuchii]|uniref:BTB domain-containing protein n=1 Tax=Cercospora kikuchii TaxID=84275 RepID=A0A9P3FFZ0_9PEZI|nr:uncharacterized protein CKM354_000906200 [Cercospora kikuchii]GIZ45916.1 hypothetical protein CKM354_000906200 [Cercospora kikuchii]
MADSDRAAKRQKKMPELQIDTTTQQSPGLIVDICINGDAVLVVQGIAGIPQSVGIRVSSNALTIASPVFRRLLAPPGGLAPPTPAPGNEELLQPREVHLENEDGDALFLLLNVLHLRNDALPTRLQPDLLVRFVATCARFECLVAAGRAASQWLDYIYTKLQKSTRTSRNSLSSAFPPPTPSGTGPPTTPFSASPAPNDTQYLFQLIEASLILNDALFFTRFTTHFILTQPILTDPKTQTTSPTQRPLFHALKRRQREAVQDLRIDFDLLIDPLAETMSEDAKHYVDLAPGERPDFNQLGNPGYVSSEICTIDNENGTDLLSALRDANLWPGTRWPLLMNSTDPTPSARSQTGSVVAAVERFRVPDADTRDSCFWCMHVEDKFATALGLVRMMHKDRMWGLCLDCYRAEGGVNDTGDCRVEHYKAVVKEGAARLQVLGAAGPQATGVGAAMSQGAQSASNMATGPAGGGGGAMQSQGGAPASNVAMQGGGVGGALPAQTGPSSTNMVMLGGGFGTNGQNGRQAAGAGAGSMNTTSG